MDKEKEFAFNDDDFLRVKKTVYDYAGINLSEGKRHLVYNRLAKRIRYHGLSNFKQYLDYVDAHKEEEFTHLVNAITTNLTFFFRENHHFEQLANRIIPEAKQRHATDKRIRIWSSACSTGEEPYSIAMTVQEAMGSFSGWDLKILATDLDTNVLEHARQGIYKSDKLEGVSPEREKKWFVQGKGSNEGHVRVKDELKDLITFNQLNLVQDWPIKGPFDVIFCRNVVIYFDKPTQKKLFQRFHDLLVPGGYLILGHSESLHNLNDDFELIGQTIYQKK